MVIGRILAIIDVVRSMNIVLCPKYDMHLTSLITKWDWWWCMGEFTKAFGKCYVKRFTCEIHFLDNIFTKRRPGHIENEKVILRNWAWLSGINAHGSRGTQFTQHYNPFVRCFWAWLGPPSRHDKMTLLLGLASFLPKSFYIFPKSVESRRAAF